ncbi:hypothetical protein SLS60_001122 [Paraconiothyrium brasiliense]|uniref:Delta(24)-sterol reductase n=1 Tax=Paraconiothyrium brasiliense TaxID=300254 RepID=A0ABR3S8E0_9PLEO
MAPYTFEHHEIAVQALSEEVAAFHKALIPFRINHGSTHATRMRPPGTPQLFTTHLNHILSIDVTGKYAYVESNVKLGDILQEAQKVGLMPTTLMDFPDVTVGGGFSGASGESMCWEEGLFDACVLEVELILGNGEVVRAVKGGLNADLFDAARCSLGTLGVVTLVKMRLREAKDSVLVTYEKKDSVKGTIDRIAELCDNDDPDYDYIDGVVYSQTHGVVVYARHIDSKSTEAKKYSKQRFDRPLDEWCYRHTKDVPSGHSEVVPLRSYLFRWDRGAFWGGETMLAYFGVPSNRITRALFDKLCNARGIYKAQLSTGSADFAIIQDLILPVETSKEWVDYVDEELGIWPMWCTPVRKLADDSEVWGHPFWKSKPGEQPAGVAQKRGRLFMDWGVWGACDGEPEAFNKINRRLEERLKELRGMKLIYAASFYTEDEFWDLYDRKRYEDARKKWHAETMPTVWDKIRRDPPKSKEETEEAKEGPLTFFERLLWIWPFGGLYQVFCILFR